MKNREYYIQSRDSVFITIYINMIDVCNAQTFNKEKRHSEILNKNCDLFLGGKIHINNKGFDLSDISKQQFDDSGVDVNLFKERFINIYNNI